MVEGERVAVLTGVVGRVAGATVEAVVAVARAAEARAVARAVEAAAAGGCSVLVGGGLEVPHRVRVRVRAPSLSAGWRCRSSSTSGSEGPHGYPSP